MLAEQGAPLGKAGAEIVGNGRPLVLRLALLRLRSHHLPNVVLRTAWEAEHHLAQAKWVARVCERRVWRLIVLVVQSLRLCPNPGK